MNYSQSQCYLRHETCFSGYDKKNKTIVFQFKCTLFKKYIRWWISGHVMLFSTANIAHVFCASPSLKGVFYCLLQKWWMTVLVRLIILYLKLFCFSGFPAQVAKNLQMMESEIFFLLFSIPFQMMYLSIKHFHICALYCLHCMYIPNGQAYIISRSGKSQCFVALLTFVFAVSQNRARLDSEALLNLKSLEKQKAQVLFQTILTYLLLNNQSTTFAAQSYSL